MLACPLTLASKHLEKTGGGVLWEDYDVDLVCNFRRLKHAKDSGTDAFIHDFYNMLREKIKLVEPNAFHYFIRDVLVSGIWDVHIITTNLDDLFERANVPKERVHHLHGSIDKYRCRRCQQILQVGQTCSKHCSLVATDAVFYGEISPYYSKGKRAFSRLCKGDMIMMVGFSGETFGEAMTYWAKCRLRGVETIHVNPSPQSHHLYPSDHHMCCRIQQALPRLQDFSRPDTFSIIKGRLQ